MKSMLWDWWVAHRLEVYLSLALWAVVGTLGLLIWWERRRGKR